MGANEGRMYLSYSWKMRMPKTATSQLMKAVMTMPTMMLMLPPLTADSICPAMMQLMHPYPIIRIMLSTHVSFPGQYPMKYLAQICIVQMDGVSLRILGPDQAAQQLS